jgi:hypothetical protein
MNDTIELLRAALQHDLDRSVKVMSRAEWVNANHPNGRPAKLPRPLSPFLGVERTGKMETAAASAQPFADVPGFHIVRRDPKDAPDIFNTDSHDVIEDLPSNVAWARVLRICNLRDTYELRELARKHVFLAETRRIDHHSPHVPKDIAGAEPRDEG